MATTPLSSPGIGSGLDVNGIVQKLMAVESQPLQLLDQKTTIDQAKISAFGTLKSALSTLQTALQGLATPASLRSLNASAANASVLTATVGSGAVAGNYELEVSQLARAQKLVSAAQANATTSIGTGTLTFDFGTTSAGVFTSNGSGAKTVTIAAGQDTLAGIRDAVNAAQIGVTATLVNDGGSPGTHLVFTSSASGAANSMRIAVADGDGTNTDTAGLSQLAFDPVAAAGSGQNMTEQVSARDALLTIDGIAVHAASNTVTDAIEGLTLNLLATNVGAPTTLSVASDPSVIGTAVAAFVKSYNDLDATFDNLTKYDATKKQASVLTGDGTVRNIQTRLRTLLGGMVGSGTYSTLGQVGVSFQGDGTLKVDSTKLNAAIAANAASVTQLFAAMGSATDSAVLVSGFTTATQPGTYALDVSQLATQGTLVGQTPAGLTITAGVNDSLTVLLDGINASVVLAAGTYATPDALAAEVQARINGATAFTSDGATVGVSQSGGVLTFTSGRWGAASSVALSGSAAASLVGAAPTSAPGVDAAGTLDGTALQGSGQVLRGATGGPFEGLVLTVGGGPLGARGTVTYQTGIAYRLNEMVKQVIGADGALAARTDGLQKDLTSIDKQRDALNVRLARVQANYFAQFNALDTLLANLSAQSTALTQQLANLPKTSNGSNN